MEIYVDSLFLDNQVKKISRKYNLEIVNNPSTKGNYFTYDSKGLSFVYDSNYPKESLNINFLKGKTGWRIKRASHEGNLKKALGRSKDRMIIYDATAGLLTDTMIFLSLGHKVTAIEQSKIIYLLVKDAIYRAQYKIPFLNNLEFINANSIDYYKKIDTKFDAIYLDPMYPVVKKNIKKSGDLRSIGSILEIESLVSDEDYLINNFINSEYKKLILKRPLKSKKIYSTINYQVKGKTTRFDVFI